jgi:hypothetical protein
MSSDVPVKKPSSPSLQAVRPQKEEPGFSPDAIKSLLMSTGAKVTVLDESLDRMATEMARQTVLIRGIKHDQEINSAIVVKMEREQHVIKGLLGEILARLPEPTV